jgi:hypothetical protein
LNKSSIIGSNIEQGSAHKYVTLTIHYRTIIGPKALSSISVREARFVLRMKPERILTFHQEVCTNKS